MSVHPMLVSLAREYVQTIDMIGGGRFKTNTELHDLEGQRGMLHEQLMSVVNAADYEEAQRDTYVYAVKVIRWSRSH